MSHPFIATSVNAMTMIRISGIIQELNDILNENRDIFVSDFYKIIGIQSEDPYTFEYGWKNLEGMTVTFKYNLYTLELPEPEELKKKFDPSKYDITVRFKGDWCSLEIRPLKGTDEEPSLTSEDFKKTWVYVRERVGQECEKRNL